MGCGQVIKEMTDGGADYCFECIGLASVMNDAFNSSREGWGKTVILGVEMHGSPISLNSIEILKGRSVCGTFFGGLKPKSDIAYSCPEVPRQGFIYIHRHVVTKQSASSREGWGKTVILGVEMHGSPISLNSIEILKGRSVCGTFFGGLKPKSDIATLAQKYLDKELNLDEFITHEVSFHDINKAFDLLLEGKSLRCVIWIDKQN
ncbi:hypothetical protein CUMW_060510 [Citrus unshiu]|uniref:Alcohol dehydrogenase-like C-terminal domain-containing protein n=1 Tax=Citrus unshiu TaxID=55188 RepID=A0A2H5NNR2_CITUN|nr:hypothetical protein CUMW_060510 [Citrus unshiu]